MAQPNFILILTDQEREPPFYEKNNETFSRFVQTKLKAHTRLRKNGVYYENHYTVSAACSPSRASIFTGLPLKEHGVSQTTGFAKRDDDPEIKWLDPNTKTLGNHMRNAGYDTYYYGKWHLSHETDPDTVEHFGFSGWKGPEPHGPEFSKAGFNMDHRYVDAAIKILSERDSNKPFLLVLSLVNPHDIVLYIKIRSLMPFAFNDNCADFPPAPRAEFELSQVAKQYMRSYREIMMPKMIHNFFYKNKNSLKRLYFNLLFQVDEEINRFLDYYIDSVFYDNTYIFFTSDHGDMLGAKGLQQKWYVPYEEAIHVPFIIHHPKIIERQYDCLTCSLDIIPTILSLANAPVMMSGRDLSDSLHTRHYSSEEISRVIKFETIDDIISGRDNYPLWYTIFPRILPILIRNFGRYNTIKGPTDVTAIIGMVESPSLKLYKLCCCGGEYELFNLSDDPCETINLFQDPFCSPVVKYLLSFMNG